MTNAETVQMIMQLSGVGALILFLIFLIWCGKYVWFWLVQLIMQPIRVGEISKSLKNIESQIVDANLLNKQVLGNLKAQVALNRQLLKAYGHEPEV